MSPQVVTYLRQSLILPTTRPRDITLPFKVQTRSHPAVNGHLLADHEQAGAEEVALSNQLNYRTALVLGTLAIIYRSCRLILPAILILSAFVQSVIAKALTSGYVHTSCFTVLLLVAHSVCID